MHKDKKDYKKQPKMYNLIKFQNMHQKPYNMQKTMYKTIFHKEWW